MVRNDRAPSDRIENPDAFAPPDPGGLPDSDATQWTRPVAQGREQDFENVLRPRLFSEFVGQSRVVSNLRIALEAARARGESLDHVLLSGPPGLGKTSLARIIGAELGTQVHATSGPALERPRDLVGILTQLSRGDLFFIDEVHRIPPSVEEFLYTAMEDFSVDFTLDQGPNARILPLTLAPFTLVGATTREGLLSAAFRGRFGLLERLVPYPDDELATILLRSASILEVELDPAAAQLIAGRSRGTPRVANRFLRRVRDLAQVKKLERIDTEVASDALARIGVDERGLEDIDRRLLNILADARGEPIGLKTLAASLDEAEDTIEDVVEPHLLRSGLLQKTARGRVLTRNGRRALGLPPDETGPGAIPDLFD